MPASRACSTGWPATTRRASRRSPGPPARGGDGAIVPPIAGTTRDVLRERIHLDGLPLHVLDTAGLRSGGDLVEEEGMRRAQAEVERAARVLFVCEAAE